MNHRRNLVIEVAFLAPLLAVSGISPYAAANRPWQLKKVYEHKLDHQREFRDYSSYENIRGVFGPAGDVIYLFRKNEIRAINWRTGSVIAHASVSTFPQCATNWPDSLADRFTAWFFSPVRPVILARYCGSMYLLDPETLSMEKEPCSLASTADRIWLVPLNGRTAISVRGTQTEEGEIYVRLLDLEACSGTAEWSIKAEGVGDLALSPDGTLLAISLYTTQKREGVRFTEATGIQIRRVPSGEVEAEWWRKKDNGLIEKPRFVPGKPHLLVTNSVVSFKPFMLDYWDARTGELVKTISHDDGHWAWRDEIFFASDWSYAVDSHIDDPQDLRFTQDFVVWNPWTGGVLYESPKKKWSVSDEIIFFTPLGKHLWPRLGHEILDISRDGKYLLVAEWDRVEIWQVIRPHED